MSKNKSKQASKARQTKEPKGHLIDAKGEGLGRLATRVANFLRGKDKIDFAYNREPGDLVVVINTDFLKLTGRKLEKKIYFRHSKYPGGLKREELKDLLVRDSREVVRRAVLGMLPKNRLRSRMILRLKLYKKDCPKKIYEKISQSK